MVSVKLSTTPNFALWDLPRNPPRTLPLPQTDSTSLFSRSPFSIPESIFFGALDYKWPLLLATLYVSTVTLWNQVNRQRNAKPWAISKTSTFFWLVVAHNVFLAVYSIWTFIGIFGAARRSFSNPFTSPGGFHDTMDSLCRIQGPSGVGNALIFNKSSDTHGWSTAHPSLHSLTNRGIISAVPQPTDTGRLWNEGLAFYGWLFYISKYYEFLDTAIILLKGKQSSTLQTYHHMGACGCLFVGIKYMSPPIWIFLFFNSFIHALMYTYYTITAFEIRVPKMLKQSLTTAQITQFIVGGGSALLHLFVYYKYPSNTPKATSIPCLDSSAQAFAVWFNVIYLTPLTYLFARFFVKSYLRPGPKTTRHVDSSMDNHVGSNRVPSDESKTFTQPPIPQNHLASSQNGGSVRIRTLGKKLAE